MLRLETFGGLVLTAGGVECPQPRRRLAVLARLAAPGALGVSRDELHATFWPERDVVAARHSLDQLLYETRRALGASPTAGTGTLRLDPGVITSDVADWTAALQRGDLAAAAALCRGPFLHGFHLRGSPEFEQWVERVRAQLAGEHRRVLEALATHAASDGRPGDAVVWWRRLAAADPFGSRAALGLMRALSDAGDRAGALEFARVHERVVRAELETAPDPAVASFAESLRAVPAPPPVTRPAASEPAVLSTAAASRVSSAESAAAAAAAAAVEPRPRARHRWPSPWAPGYLAAVAALTVLFALRGATSGRGHAEAGTAPRGAAHETANIAAHELYVRGLDPTLLRSDSGVRAAIDYLGRAIALDPTYAAAYAALAGRCATATYGITLTSAERRAMYARGEAAARRAIALDGSLADAHAELGYLELVGYEPAAAAAELRRAIALDPAASSPRETLAKAYEWAGRPADAVAEARRAVRTDPLSASTNAELGYALYFARRYDEALAQLAKVATIHPPLRRAPEYTAQVYAATGRWREAIAVLRPVASRSPLARGLLGHALARAGERAEATRLLGEMLADESAGLAPASGVAEVYVGLGDYDRAFVWLDRSFDDFSLRANIMGPLYDDLRADPRFDRVRRRLGRIATLGPRLSATAALP